MVGTEKQIELMKSHIQSKLEQIPRAVNGGAPKQLVDDIIDDIYNYKFILEKLEKEIK